MKQEGHRLWLETRPPSLGSGAPPGPGTFRTALERPGTGLEQPGTAWNRPGTAWNSLEQACTPAITWFASFNAADWLRRQSAAWSPGPASEDPNVDSRYRGIPL